MPSSHQLTLASQLARLRPTVMPGMAQDISGPGASLAAAAAAASLGLPFSLPHHHGLSISNLGLGLHGMLPTPERQGVMAGFGMTTPQPQLNSTTYPSTFPAIPQSLLSPDYPSADMLPSELFTTLGMIQPINATATGSQGEMTGSDCSDRSGMTWLDAAQVVLQEAGKPLHIKEIKQRILERGLVQSNARSSLEAVLYRDTQKGSRRFKRVDGEIGMFRIMLPEEKTKKRSKPTLVATRKKTSAKDNALLQTIRYKGKYRRLRKLIKLMIFENAALNDEVCRSERKIQRAQQERFFLLQRLLHCQEICAIPPSATKSTSATKHSASKRHAEDMEGSLVSPQASASKREKGDKNKAKRKRKKAKRADKDKARKDAGRVKTKRSSGVSTKRLVQQIPLDSTGKPIFPIKLSSLTVHSLGQIVTDRTDYHDEHCIYPTGFCSSRMYTSAKDPRNKCLYTCKVLDAGLTPRVSVRLNPDW